MRTVMQNGAAQFLQMMEKELQQALMIEQLKNGQMHVQIQNGLLPKKEEKTEKEEKENRKKRRLV